MDWMLKYKVNSKSELRLGTSCKYQKLSQRLFLHDVFKNSLAKSLDIKVNHSF